MIAEGRGSKTMESVLKKAHKHKWISAVTSDSGRVLTGRSEISEVFVRFYEQLYHHTTPVQTKELTRPGVVTVTVEDVRRACEKLNKKRTCADDGLLAEMLETDFEPLLQALAEAFTDLLQGTTDVPSSLLETRLTILFKKGDPKVPGNYRPIAVLPGCTSCLQRFS